jgi:hypothetical protein
MFVEPQDRIASEDGELAMTTAKRWTFESEHWSRRERPI